MREEPYEIIGEGERIGEEGMCTLFIQLHPRSTEDHGHHLRDEGGWKHNIHSTLR
jgi:hypothetical protein